MSSNNIKCNTTLKAKSSVVLKRPSKTKDNSVFLKFVRTIRTEITCVTNVKEMHKWQ
jgi:hypothetical protein